MKINVPKDWLLEKSKLEEGQEIGAGNPHFMEEITTPEPSIIGEASKERDSLRAKLEKLDTGGYTRHLPDCNEDWRSAKG